MSDPEDQEDTVSEDDAPFETMTPEKRARHAITGRGVTLQMLMADGIIEPGEGVLSLEYLVSMNYDLSHHFHYLWMPWSREMSPACHHGEGRHTTDANGRWIIDPGEDVLG